MGEKDITQKILEDYDDIFADIVNVLVFNGKRRIKPEELKNAIVHSQYKDDKSRLHEQERDVAKYWMNNNIEIALYGLENQVKSFKQMSLRVFGYEGASYRTQLGKENVVPVLTLVLYFGEKHWEYPKNLKDIIKIPKGLEDYVNDIKINVYEISWLTDEQVQMFTSDFKIVANFFVNKRKNKDYIPNDPTEIIHIDEVLKLLAAMTGDYRYEEILTYEGQVKNMCDVANRLEEKGRAEGRAEGIILMVKENYIEGAYTAEQSVKKLAEKLGVSNEEAEIIFKKKIE